MSSTLVVVASMPAFGQAAPDPELDRIWGGCVLSNAALTALQASLTSSSNRIGTPQIAAVVIYSRDNPNSGQPVTVGPTSGFTGAVVCRNAALFPAANTTSQGDPIPPSGGTTTIQNADQSSLFRYGTSEFDMRLCHTVRTNVDCFRYE
jgi:hypothetical protein